eukprot:gene12724-biopygen16955
MLRGTRTDWAGSTLEVQGAGGDGGHARKVAAGPGAGTPVVPARACGDAIRDALGPGYPSLGWRRRAQILVHPRGGPRPALIAAAPRRKEQAPILPTTARCCQESRAETERAKTTGGKRTTVGGGGGGGAIPRRFPFLAGRTPERAGASVLPAGWKCSESPAANCGTQTDKAGPNKGTGQGGEQVRLTGGGGNGCVHADHYSGARSDVRLGTGPGT